MDLEEERQRNSRLEKMAPHPMSAEETEWETKKAMDDYKFKLQKAEQDINTLQTNVRTHASVCRMAIFGSKSSTGYSRKSNIIHIYYTL